MTSAEPVGSQRIGDRDPYPTYAWLREHAPVSLLFAPFDGGKKWLVTSHDLARACLTDPRLSNDSRKARGGADELDGAEIARGLLSLDRPEHARLRGMLARTFSPQAVNRWRAMIARESQAAIDRIAGVDRGSSPSASIAGVDRGSSPSASTAGRARADMVSDFALPVPVAVIHEILGIPASERKDAARCFDLFYRSAIAQPHEAEAYQELIGYIDHFISYKRGHRGEDVTSLLLEHADRGELPDPRELRSMVLGIFGAGHVTTVQFFGAAVLRLLEHPDQLADLMAGRVRWPDVVNEIVRFDSPIQVTQHRYAVEDMRIGDVQIARGDAVLISVAAANRDPAVIEDPARFDVNRGGRASLAFGHGVHLCLGIHLARLEGEIGLDMLFRRLPGLRLAIPATEVAWAYGPLLRGPKELPVIWTDRLKDGVGGLDGNQSAFPYGT